MKDFLDAALVGLALLTATGYALWSLGPRSLRHRLLRWIGRLDAASAAQASSSCGGCGSCASTPGGAGGSRAAAGEVKIPLARITRRG